MIHSSRCIPEMQTICSLSTYSQGYENIDGYFGGKLKYNFSILAHSRGFNIKEESSEKVKELSRGFSSSSIFYKWGQINMTLRQNLSLPSNDSFPFCPFVVDTLQERLDIGEMYGIIAVNLPPST